MGVPLGILRLLQRATIVLIRGFEALVVEATWETAPRLHTNPSEADLLMGVYWAQGAKPRLRLTWKSENRSSKSWWCTCCCAVVLGPRFQACVLAM